MSNAGLKNLIAANRWLLQQLDTQLALLREHLDVDRRDRLNRHPHFYSALGEDGQNGILLGPGPAREYTGKVRIDPDSPFMWTHVLVAQRFEAPVDKVADRGFMGVWRGAAGTEADAPPTVDLGFIDQGAGRVLFQSERQSPDGGPDAADTLVTGALFDLAGMHRVSGGGFSDGIVNQWAGGLGPNFGLKLGAEVALPPNDVIEVRAKPSFIDERLPRVYVTLLGYKVDQ